MVKHNQNGAVSGLVISFVMVVVLLLGSIIFAAWAYKQQQLYKGNGDVRVAAAKKAATEAADAAKEKEFLERVKQPYKTYQGPEAVGSLVVQFPKTWSGYVDDVGSSGTADLDGYFSPGVVPSISNTNSVFALRIQVLPQPYDKVLESFDGQQQAGKLTIRAYSLPKLPKIIGVEVQGELVDQKNVTMVVLPLRADTLEISTQGNQYLNDFNTDILPNLSFSP